MAELLVSSPIWRPHRGADRAVYDAIADSLALARLVVDRRPRSRRSRRAIRTPRSATSGATRSRARLPYTLSFDLAVARTQRPTTLAGSATGELEGTGVWTPDRGGGGVDGRPLRLEHPRRPAGG